MHTAQYSVEHADWVSCARAFTGVRKKSSWFFYTFITYVQFGCCIVDMRSMELMPISGGKLDDSNFHNLLVVNKIIVIGFVFSIFLLAGVAFCMVLFKPNWTWNGLFLSNWRLHFKRHTRYTFEGSNENKKTLLKIVRQLQKRPIIMNKCQ